MNIMDILGIIFILIVLLMVISFIVAVIRAIVWWIKYAVATPVIRYEMKKKADAKREANRVRQQELDDIREAKRVKKEKEREIVTVTRTFTVSNRSRSRSRKRKSIGGLILGTVASSIFKGMKGSMRYHNRMMKSSPDSRRAVGQYRRRNSKY